MELFRIRKGTNDWQKMISTIQQRSFEPHSACGEQRPGTTACLSRLCRVSDRLQASTRSIKNLVIRHLERIATEQKLQMVFMSNKQIQLRSDCFGVLLFINEETGNIESVKFDITNSPQLCPELTSDLQLGKFDSLVSHIEEISAVYNIPGQTSNRQKAWLCLQSLEEDLVKLSTVPLPMYSALANLKEPSERVNSSSIGLVRKRIGGLSGRLLYAAMNKSKNQTDTDIWSRQNNWCAKITLQASQHENLLPFVPLVTLHSHPEKKNKVSFTQLDNVKSVALYAQFALVLQPPLVIEVNLLKELESITKTKLTPDQPAENLVKLILSQSEEYVVPSSPIFINSPIGQQAYHVNCTLYGHLLDKVVFTETREIMNIVAVLRRMAAFNSFLNTFIKFDPKIQRKCVNAISQYHVDITSLDHISVALDHFISKSRGKSVTIKIDSRGTYDCDITPPADYQSTIVSSLQECQSLPLVLSLIELAELKSGGLPFSTRDVLRATVIDLPVTESNQAISSHSVTGSSIERVKRLTEHNVKIQDTALIKGDGPPPYKLDPVVIPSRPVPLSIPIPQPSVPVHAPVQPIATIPQPVNKMAPHHSFPSVPVSTAVNVPNITSALTTNTPPTNQTQNRPAGLSGLAQPMSDIRLDDLLRNDTPYSYTPNISTSGGLSHAHSYARPARADADSVLISLLNDESNALQSANSLTYVHKMENINTANPLAYPTSGPASGQPSPNKPGQVLSCTATAQPILSSPAPTPSAVSVKNSLYYGAGSGGARCQLPGVMATSAPKQMHPGGSVKSRMSSATQPQTKKQRKRHGEDDILSAPHKKHKPPNPMSILTSSLDSSLDGDATCPGSSTGSTGFEFTVGNSSSSKMEERSSTPTPVHNLSFSSSSSGGQLSRQSSLESRYANNTPRSVSNVYDFNDDIPASSIPPVSGSSVEKSLRMTIKTGGSSLPTVKISSDKTASPLKKLKSQPTTTTDCYNKQGPPFPTGGISVPGTKAATAPKSVSNIMMQNSTFSGLATPNYPSSAGGSELPSMGLQHPQQPTNNQPKKRKRRTKEEMQRDKILGVDPKKKKKELSSSSNMLPNFPVMPGVNSVTSQQVFNPNLHLNMPSANPSSDKGSIQQAPLSIKPPAGKNKVGRPPNSGGAPPRVNSVSSVKQKLKEKTKKNAGAAADTMLKSAGSTFPTSSTPFGSSLGENLVTNYRIPKKASSNPSSEISSPSMPPTSTHLTSLSGGSTPNINKTTFPEAGAPLNTNKSSSSCYQSSVPHGSHQMSSSSSYRDNTATKEKSSLNDPSNGSHSSQFEENRPTFGALPPKFQQNRGMLSRPPTAIQPNRSKSGMLCDPEPNNTSAAPVQARSLGSSNPNRPSSSINAIADKLMVARSTSQSNSSSNDDPSKRSESEQGGPVENIFEKLTTSQQKSLPKGIVSGPAPIFSSKETPDSPTEQPVTSCGPNVQNIPVSPPAPPQSIPDTSRLNNSDGMWPRFGRPIYGSSLQFSSGNNGNSSERH